MIAEHCSRLAAILNTGQRSSRVLFSLLCVERLKPCCWAFGKEFGQDISSFLSGCHEALDFLVTGKISRELDILKRTYSKNIHTSDDFGTVVAVQAQFGMISLANTLELCFSDDVDLATNSAENVIDAIDNYELYAWQSVPGSGEFQESQNYWLLEAELVRQVRQASQVMSMGHDGLVRMLIENRQFVVPPAVP